MNRTHDTHNKTRESPRYIFMIILTSNYLEDYSIILLKNWQNGAVGVQTGKWKVKVTQLCPPLCNPMDYTQSV